MLHLTKAISVVDAEKGVMFFEETSHIVNLLMWPQRSPANEEIEGSLFLRPLRRTLNLRLMVNAEVQLLFKLPPRKSVAFLRSIQRVFSAFFLVSCTRIGL